MSVRRRSTSCCARRRKVEEEGPRRGRKKAQSQLQQQASPNDATAPVSARSKRSPRRSSRVGVADTQEQQQQQQEGGELPAVLEDSRYQEASGVQSQLLLLEKVWQLAPADNLSDREGEGGQQQQQHAGGPPAPANDPEQLIPEPSPLPPPSGTWHPELQGLDDPGSNDEAVSNTVSHLLQVGNWAGGHGTRSLGGGAVGS